MPEKNWNIKEVEDESAVKELADSLNISMILARLLVERDIKTFNQAKTFFRGSKEKRTQTHRYN